MNRLDGAAPGYYVDVAVVEPVFSHGYDPKGRRLLIPVGSRALGDVFAVGATHQERLYVAFHKLRRPDGSTFSLNQLSTTCGLRLSERTSTRTESIDSQFDLERIIDRLQKAQKGDFEESLFEQARQQIASHHARYAREENRLPGLPDNAITAQFLAVAEWPKLAGLLADLAGERKEAGHS